MKVTFLGTGTSHGVPVIGCKCYVCKSADAKDKRLRVSVLLQVNGKNIVIDTGPDFRTQMLNVGIDRLDAVLFTHEHKDHTSGFDDVRAFNFWQEGKIPVYATKHVQENLHKSYDYIFADKKYPGIPEISLHTIHKDERFHIADIEVTPIEVMHYRLPVLGFRIGQFVYITDANYISETEREKIYGCDILVMNALRIQPHISHFSLDEAIETAKELGAKQTYFIHMSHQVGLHEEVSKSLPKNIFLAYDGLEINV